VGDSDSSFAAAAASVTCAPLGRTPRAEDRFFGVGSQPVGVADTPVAGGMSPGGVMGGGDAVLAATWLLFESIDVMLFFLAMTVSLFAAE
jgi:hypothetical protein